MKAKALGRHPKTRTYSKNTRVPAFLIITHISPTSSWTVRVDARPDHRVAGFHEDSMHQHEMRDRSEVELKESFKYM